MPKEPRKQVLLITHGFRIFRGQRGPFPFLPACVCNTCLSQAMYNLLLWHPPPPPLSFCRCHTIVDTLRIPLVYALTPGESSGGSSGDLYGVTPALYKAGLEALFRQTAGFCRAPHGKACRHLRSYRKGFCHFSQPVSFSHSAGVTLQRIHCGSPHDPPCLCCNSSRIIRGHQKGSPQDPPGAR